MGRWSNQVIFLLRFILLLIQLLTFPLFCLKAYLECTEPVRKKVDGLHVLSLFFGNNRQHRLVCAKAISSWVRKVLCIAKAHFSVYGFCLECCIFPGVHLAAVDWTEFLHQLDNLSTFITTTDQHQDSVQCAVLGLSE